MRLDRALIKSQAKAIIKGQVFALFLISIVVALLAGGISVGLTAGIDAFKNVTENVINNDSFLEDFQKEFGKEFGIDEDEEEQEDEEPNLDYFNDFTGSVSLVTFPGFKNDTMLNISSRLGNIVTLIMAPLTIALCGLYVMIIRGSKMKTDDFFKYVFTKTFDANYIKKLLLYVLKSIILTVMFCLFIIPGIVFYYRYYFAEMIMADNPEMSAKEALKRSKEMTDGHKGELFALDLSFIGWALLIPLTLGLVSIYFIPYASTTKALYYENFRIRCIQESAQPQLKYMTADEINNFYTTQQQQPVQPIIVEEPKDTFGSGMDNNYYNGNF